MSVHVGDTAPDFKLSNQFGEEISLSGLRGKPVVLVFYPFSFSGICTGELCELRDNIAIFETAGVELLAVSVDSKYAQAKFAEQEGYSFNVLADFWPHGAVAETYGVFLADKGFATRATFVIDAEGVVAAKMVNGPGEARSLAEYKKALELVL
jgi:mycoredoxin-dependent peroxiredoxin